MPLTATAGHLEGWCKELGREAAAAVAAEGVPAGEIEVRRRIVALRFAGQESTLPVEYQGAAALAPAFAAAYREVYGYQPEGRAIEVESLRVVTSSGRAAASGFDGGAALGGSDAPVGAEAPGGCATPPASAHRCSVQRAFIAGSWREVPAHERSALAAGAAFPGPALVVEDHTATVVEAGWTCCLDRAGALVLRRLPSGSLGPYT